VEVVFTFDQRNIETLALNHRMRCLRDPSKPPIANKLQNLPNSPFFAMRTHQPREFIQMVLVQVSFYILFCDEKKMADKKHA